MQNQNDVNQDSSIDPSFLPKDSNLYVRTMNGDLNNLKNQGGEALPYVQDAVTIPVPHSQQTPNIKPMPIEPQGQPFQQIELTPVIEETSFTAPKTTPSQSVPDFSKLNIPTSDNNMPTFENTTPTTPEQMSPNNIPIPKIDFTNTMSSPMGLPEIPSSSPLPKNIPTVPDYSKINLPIDNEQFQNMASNKGLADVSPIASAEPDLDSRMRTDNLSSDLNNLITPEGFSPISNVDPNQTKPEAKNKLMMLIIILGILALIITAYLILRPSFFKPRVTVDTVSDGNNLLTPPSTVSTTKPSPFLLVKNDFSQSNLNIDISKSPEVVKQITEEAKVLGQAQSFKVIVPKIKDQFLSSSEVLNAFVENAPIDLTNNLDSSYLLYTYYGEFKPALGIVLTINPSGIEQVKKAFLAWEVNRDIIKNTLNFWLFSPKSSRGTLFKDTTVLGATVRYFEYPENEVAFSYAFYENFLIMTTSIESVNSALIHIQNGNTSVIK